jgi:hypothetical protein
VRTGIAIGAVGAGVAALIAVATLGDRPEGEPEPEPPPGKNPGISR